MPFKLIIPANVQKRLDLVCLKIDTTEWSGSLFYEVEGSWRDNNLVIKVLDFYLQDIGSTSSTTFEQSPDVVRYRVDNNLLQTHMGLIHSHHNMASFFSGTDMNTLKSEALDHDHFVSLIVNNKREYVAAITAVIDAERKISTKEKLKYTTFNGEEIIIEDDSIKETEETAKEIIYSMLDIEIEDYENSNIDIIERIEEIKKEKAAKKVIESNYYGGRYGINNSYTQHNAKPWENKNYNPHARANTPPSYTNPFASHNTQQKLDLDIEEESTHTSFLEYMKKKHDTDVEVMEEMIPEITIDPTIIEYKARQLVSMSRMIPADNDISIRKFISNMDILADKSFSTFDAYKSFIGYYVEDIILDAEIFNLPDFKHIDDDFIVHNMAVKLIDFLELEAANNTNIYFEELLTEISLYLLD